MISQKTKTRIKLFIIKYFSFLYPLVYIFYKYLKPGEADYRDIRLAQFTRAGFYDFELDSTKFKIFLDPKNGGVDAEIFRRKVFEPNILRFIRESLNKDSVFLDVGANIGQHSLFASNFCKKVYSFEPIKDIYNQFSKSIKENNFQNINLQNFALGEKEEILPIYSTNANMGASSLIKIGEAVDFKENTEIKKLDNVIKELNIEKIDLIKIDVEGYEYNVLLGGEEVIKIFRPKILMEYSPDIYENIGKDIIKNIFEFLSKYYINIYDIGLNMENKVKINSLEEMPKKGTNLLLEN